VRRIGKVDVNGNEDKNFWVKEKLGQELFGFDEDGFRGLR
jgi:hypothetical protein